MIRFFDWFGSERSDQLQFVCSDMWKPYLNVIADKAAQAIHVLDRFHIMAHLSKAIDEVRAGEARQMKADGFEPLSTNSRWLLLKQPENLTEKQEAKLAELLQYNLKSIRSYLLKVDFQQLWQYTSPAWAGKFIDIGRDVDDTQYHGSALYTRTGEVINFKCRPTLKGLLG